MRRYPAYKDSGLPWVGQIPAHWDMLKGKRLFKQMNRPVRDEDDVVTAFRNGTVTLRRNVRTEGFTTSLKEIGYQGVRNGDLVIHAMDGFAGAIGVSDSDGKCSPVYAVCQPFRDANPHYYAYLLRHMARSAYIIALAKGIRERSTDFRFSEFAQQEYPVPPTHEQFVIAGYLDEKLAEIDRFIANKRRLMVLLEEQRTALINRVVTRGIDTDVLRKPSGIGGLSKIPAHWEITRLKFAAEIQTGLTLGSVYTNQKTINRPYLRVANVQFGYFDLTDIKTIDIPVSMEERYLLRRGDVLVTEGGDFDKLGRGSVWEAQIEPCLHQNHIFCIRPDSKILDPYFLAALMASSYARYYFIRTSKQTTNLASTNSTTLGNLPLLVPPLVEQRYMLQYIADQADEIDEAIGKSQREIELIEEYRTALISEVVTGKVDVREAALALETALAVSGNGAGL